jgi:hypothetical protein
VLWKFNRFLPEKPCQTGTLLKTLLLKLIDVELLATICVILPPARRLCLYTRQRPPRERLRSHGLTGSYSGPEVSFEEIAVSFLQARFSGVSRPQLEWGCSDYLMASTRQCLLNLFADRSVCANQNDSHKQSILVSDPRIYLFTFNLGGQSASGVTFDRNTSN